jgi:hypothetical protein
VRYVYVNGLVANGNIPVINLVASNIVKGASASVGVSGMPQSHGVLQQRETVTGAGGKLCPSYAKRHKSAAHEQQ